MRVELRGADGARRRWSAEWVSDVCFCRVQTFRFGCRRAEPTEV